jgi:hypothetical protein
MDAVSRARLSLKAGGDRAGDHVLDAGRTQRIGDALQQLRL